MKKTDIKAVPRKKSTHATNAAEASPANHELVFTALLEGSEEEKLDPSRKSQLEAIFGMGGHATAQLSADHELQRQWALFLTDNVRAANYSLEGRSFIQIEAIFETGITNLIAPIVSSTKVKEEVIKFARSHALDGVLKLSPIIGRGADAVSLVTRIRGFLFAAAANEMTAEALAKLVRSSATFTNSLGIPSIRAKARRFDELADVVEKMNEVSAKPYKIASTERGSVMLKRMSTGYTPGEALRMAEHLALHRMNEVVVGVATFGQSLVSKTQTKLGTWHKARRETGVILPGDFDGWTALNEIARGLPEHEGHPMRFDRSMAMLGKSRLPRARKPSPKQLAEGRRKRFAMKQRKMKHRARAKTTSAL